MDAPSILESVVDELIKQAEALGIKVDKRWKEERLREEIEKALADKPSAQSVAVSIDMAPGVTGGEIAAELAKALPEPEKKFSGVTIKNMTANANKRLGIQPFGLLVLSDEQLADRQFMARIDHGVATGVLEIYQ